MTQADALYLVAFCEAVWKEMPDSKKVVYTEALLPHDKDRVEQALRALTKTSSFLPSVAEILQAIVDTRPFGDSAGTPRAELPSGEMTEEERKHSLEVMHEVLGGYLARARAATEEKSEPERPLRYTKASKVTAPRCSGAGQAPEIRDGKAFCPGCGVPIDEMFA